MTHPFAEALIPPKTAPAIIAIPSTGPDWNSITEEFLCPLCQYNLRGLSEPRCPECGCQFEWAELFNREFIHPYLFEHHPERKIWSFGKTLVSTLRPARFWTELKPTHEPRPKRLFMYWLMAAVSLVLANVILFATFLAILNWGTRRTVSPGSIISIPGGFSFLPTTVPPISPDWSRFSGAQELTAASILAVCWPWLTFLSLMVFQQTMHQAKIRPIHVLRCVLYNGDAIIWLALVAAAGSLFAATAIFHHLLPAGPPLIPPDRSFYDACLLTPIHLTTILLAIMLPLRMCAAYRCYLHFCHAFATVIASQIIVALAALIIMVYGISSLSL